MDLQGQSEILKEQRRLYTSQYEKREEEARKWCNGRCLEIGCGEYPVFKDSIKIDIRPIKGVLQHDVNKNLPFKSETFDSIIALELIEHLWNTFGFLDECNRVLKPEGRIIFSTPNVKHWRNRLKLLLGNDENFIVEDLGHVRYFSPESLSKIMKEHGFKIVDIKPIERVPFLSLCGGFIIKVVKK